MVGSIPLRNTFTHLWCQEIMNTFTAFHYSKLKSSIYALNKDMNNSHQKIISKQHKSRQDIFSLKRRKGEWSQFGRFIETHSPLMLSDSWAHKGFHWSAINSFLFITRNTLLHKTFNCLHLQDPGKVKKTFSNNFQLFFLHSSSISNVTQLTEKLSHIFSWDNFVCFTVYLFVVCFYQSWFL